MVKIIFLIIINRRKHTLIFTIGNKIFFEYSYPKSLEQIFNIFFSLKRIYNSKSYKIVLIIIKNISI